MKYIRDQHDQTMFLIFQRPFCFKNMGTADDQLFTLSIKNHFATAHHKFLWHTFSDLVTSWKLARGISDGLSEDLGVEWFKCAGPEHAGLCKRLSHAGQSFHDFFDWGSILWTTSNGEKDIYKLWSPFKRRKCKIKW